MVHTTHTQEHYHKHNQLLRFYKGHEELYLWVIISLFTYNSEKYQYSKCQYIKFVAVENYNLITAEIQSCSITAKFPLGLQANVWNGKNSQETLHRKSQNCNHYNCKIFIFFLLTLSISRKKSNHPVLQRNFRMYVTQSLGTYLYIQVMGHH